jgi:adenylate cyclase
MGREIERKYLVRDESWRRDADQGVRYRQGYLSLEPGRSVRVRQAGDLGFLTIKGPSEGAGRDEFEYPIPLADAEHLLNRLCIQPLIEKTRYTIQHSGWKWEIDEFAGENRGLIVAEIEIPDERQTFDKPGWAGEEVTHDRRYYNSQLVLHPYPEWAPPRSE